MVLRGKLGFYDGMMSEIGKGVVLSMCSEATEYIAVLNKHPSEMSWRWVRKISPRKLAFSGHLAGGCRPKEIADLLQVPLVDGGEIVNGGKGT